jgi:hypothetical protein
LAVWTALAALSLICGFRLLVDGIVDGDAGVDVAADAAVMPASEP